MDRDIFRYLKHSIKSIGAGWPSNEDIDDLVHNARGLFIWAATACRFINGGKKRIFAKERLTTLRVDRSINKPEEKLDEIYTTVLQSSVSDDYDTQKKEKHYEDLRYFLGAIILLFSPLSTIALAKLLNNSHDELADALDDMQSILLVPENRDDPLRLHHPSFRDFLLDQNRCCDQQFRVDKKISHTILARSCLRIMTNALKRNICDLRLPGTAISSVNNGKIKECLPVELQYACRYWVQHLRRSEACAFDKTEVDAFLQKHLLHWLEALSLIGRVSDSIRMITDLASFGVSDLSKRNR